MSWATAYAAQAKSDLEARDALLQHNLPECHQLHYLQMACEKICKAFLVSRGAAVEDLRRSHAHIAKQLPSIARHILSRQAGRVPHDTWEVDAIRTLARKIELLAPAVDAGGAAPANCEYPWEAPGGRVIVPSEHRFGIEMIYERSGVTLLKILRIVADELIASHNGL